MAQSTTQLPRAPQNGFVVTGAGMTHRGCVRDINEDMILTDPQGAIWAVADGLGGHGNGEMASRLVVDHLSDLPGGSDVADQVARALMRANSVLLEKGGPVISGTTAVVACFHAGQLYALWAGDSRLYRFRDGTLSQLTTDHSIVEDLVAAGALSRSDVAQHPEAHVLTRAIGATHDLEIGRMNAALKECDRFLLCSDGLSGALSDQEITRHLAAHGAPDLAVRALMHAALEAGAPDNVSAIVTVVHAA